MPILSQWDLRLDADAVLRGQGADPGILRNRRPQLVEIAEQALSEALPLFQPSVVYERYEAKSILHGRIRLNDGKELKGGTIVQHLGGAPEIVPVVCTIGPDLEAYASRKMETDIVYGLALYGAGSAAVEALANAACQYFEQQAAQKGWQVTIPLSPGMIGWSVEEGQIQIFNLVDSRKMGVTLTPSSIMVPLKSLSFVLGLGAELNQRGTTCDYCTMREICKYQTEHAKT
jgi:hypothetical protein